MSLKATLPARVSQELYDRSKARAAELGFTHNAYITLAVEAHLAPTAAHPPVPAVTPDCTAHRAKITELEAKMEHMAKQAWKLGSVTRKQLGL
jgi:hypothetical protein